MNHSSATPTLEVISGFVEKITFHNVENGYCVLRVKARSHRELITIIGYTSSIATGEFLQASGTWVNHKGYGIQFKADFLKVSPPTTEEGIEKYLASGMVKGIGPVYAKKLVKAFGPTVFEIIEEDPEKLKTIEGIGPHRASLIVKGWKDQKVVREIMLFLHQYNVSSSRASRIYKTFGANAIQVISENPYRLARDIRGIGFLSADQIALKMGIGKDSLIRAQAGLSHVLFESMKQGHCALPIKVLLYQAQILLDVSQGILNDALKHELEIGNLIEDTIENEVCIFLNYLYHSEQSIARLLRDVLQGPLPWGELNPYKEIPWVENQLSLTLSQSQRNAIHKALSSKLLTITGGPGVGKTTLVKSLVNILADKGIKISLCAPTGRAAKRLAECTGKNAKTIHRLLEVDPTTGKFKRGENSLLPCQLLIVDEVSMIDVSLMLGLLKALPQDAALFLIGDMDQLPSVGPGNVLADIIHSAIVPMVRLSEIFRQSSSSKIILNAHRINEGLMPNFFQDQVSTDLDSDFHFIDIKDNEDASRMIVEVVQNRIPQCFGYNPLTEIQVLSPMNKSSTGTRALNVELQKALNPNSPLKIERFGMNFCMGDKVMQIVNNYDKDVYNGDIGFITNIDPDLKELTITFENKPILYDFDELDEILLAYATTIHKAQGSEYPVVVIAFMMQHYPMLKRNLLYTGVTRGKKLVIIIGQTKALHIAINEKNNFKRWSKLREWLTI